MSREKVERSLLWNKAIITLAEKYPTQCKVLDYGVTSIDSRYKVPDHLKRFTPRHLGSIRYKMGLEGFTDDNWEVGSILQPFNGVYWNGYKYEWEIFSKPPFIIEVKVPMVDTREADPEKIESEFEAAAQKLSYRIDAGLKVAHSISLHVAQIDKSH